MKTFTFGGIHGGSTTPENGFLPPVSLRRFVLDAPTDHRQFRSEDIRSQQYHTLITMAMVPGTITNSHNLLAVLQQLQAYCSLLTSISIPASISNSYALHRYRGTASVSWPHNLVYFQPWLDFLFLVWGDIMIDACLCLLLFPPSSNSPYFQISFFSSVASHRISSGYERGKQRLYIFLLGL